MQKAPSVGTLNSKVRIDQMKKIWVDNQKMLSKISKVKSHYPVTAFNSASKKNKYLKKNIIYNSSKFIMINLS